MVPLRGRGSFFGRRGMAGAGRGIALRRGTFDPGHQHADIHAHRRESILSKDVQAAKQVVNFGCLCKSAQKPVQSLCTTSAQQHQHNVLVALGCKLLYFFKLGLTDGFFVFQNFRCQRLN